MRTFRRQPLDERCTHAITVHVLARRQLPPTQLGLCSRTGRDRLFSEPVPLVSANRRIVAVIEADAADRRTLCSLLSSLDAEVRFYDSAESYLESSCTVALDCLIADVTLPGMSGLDLLRMLRASKAPPPVILLGEESDVRAAVAGIREGAADFIEKPHADVSILRRVIYLLDHSHAEVAY